MKKKKSLYTRQGKVHRLALALQILWAQKSVLKVCNALSCSSSICPAY